MTTNRTRGWRRIGIVLSVIWFVGFGNFIWNNQHEEITKHMLARTEWCFNLYLKSDAVPYIANEEQRKKTYAEYEAKHEKCDEQNARETAERRDAVWRGF